MSASDVSPLASCAIFLDISNIFFSMRGVACREEGATAQHGIRLAFDKLDTLAVAGRPIAAQSRFCVGSSTLNSESAWERLRSIGYNLESFERGRETSTEQAVDQALQVNMLRLALDRPPGVAVLLSGDGSGAADGRGFLADLRRMRRCGWHIEVMSWADSCNPHLRRFAEAEGSFIGLDDYYEQITFLPGVRPVQPLSTRQRRVPRQPMPGVRTGSDKQV